MASYNKTTLDIIIDGAKSSKKLKDLVKGQNRVTQSASSAKVAEWGWTMLWKLRGGHRNQDEAGYSKRMSKLSQGATKSSKKTGGCCMSLEGCMGGQ